MLFLLDYINVNRFLTNMVNSQILNEKMLSVKEAVYCQSNAFSFFSFLRLGTFGCYDSPLINRTANSHTLTITVTVSCN